MTATPTVQAAPRRDNWMPPVYMTEMPPTPQQRAARALYVKRRDAILSEARSKGWRHWRGTFWSVLEKKLRAAGSAYPEIYMDLLRDEREFELEWDAHMKAKA